MTKALLQQLMLTKQMSSSLHCDPHTVHPWSSKTSKVWRGEHFLFLISSTYNSMSLTNLQCLLKNEVLDPKLPLSDFSNGSILL